MPGSLITALFDETRCFVIDLSDEMAGLSRQNASLMLRAGKRSKQM
jgi:hypothetical protein